MYKFCENRGTFIHFVEIGGMWNMGHWFWGWTPLLKVVEIVLRY